MAKRLLFKPEIKIDTIKKQLGSLVFNIIYDDLVSEDFRVFDGNIRGQPESKNAEELLRFISDRIGDQNFISRIKQVLAQFPELRGILLADAAAKDPNAALDMQPIPSHQGQLKPEPDFDPVPVRNFGVNSSPLLPPRRRIGVLPARGVDTGFNNLDRDPTIVPERPVRSRIGAAVEEDLGVGDGEETPISSPKSHYGMMQQQVEYLHVEYTPPAHDSTTLYLIDVVFVHGLNPLSKPNFATATWTHEDGTYWPTAQLKKIIPTARILTFSYNSKIAWDGSTNEIRDCAKNLLDRLSDMRKQKPPQASSTVPIIFVAHSLGGLVVKQALVAAKIKDQYKDIRDATYGLVFFAVPHRGGRDGATLGTIIKNIIVAQTGTNWNNLVGSLQKYSVFQENLAEDFKHSLEGYYIVSIFEGLSTGRSKIIVDQKSATLGLGGTRETVLWIDADHSDVCKFEGDDDSDKFDPIMRAMYKLAKGAIKKEKEKLGIHVATTSPSRMPVRMEEHVTRTNPVNTFKWPLYRPADHYNTLQLGFYHAYYQVGVDLVTGETREARDLRKRYVHQCKMGFTSFIQDGTRFSFADLEVPEFEKVLSKIHRDKYSQRFFAIIGWAGFMAYLSVEGNDKEKSSFYDKVRTGLFYLGYIDPDEVKSIITILRGISANTPRALADNIFQQQSTRNGQM